ncbi:ABC-F family ATP-binding cassette domain-containing protein [Zavarzinella formosa]|uniref:ABC-F family ATP-binding cassette domain-containing protein n=1 Tax=Zavarzinella formosa TaxID=360055 RepID=UPI00031FAB7A|nr:ABC-F family ATP-binding cassette domain-containing protein [Zavarzinella formosa]
MSVLLSGQGLTQSFSHRPLFADLSVELDSADRIGLIGPNGAGKSTLLRILTGIMTPDGGRVTTRRNARIGYLAQDDSFEPGLSVFEVIVAALANDPNLEDYERETQAAITLTQVGFEDFDQQASILSGGWRKRLSLARELAKNPEFLLMDEPTNHLDLPGVLWLEKLLRGASFGYLAATHDRAFLRAIADDIIEVSRVYPSGVFRAAGGYDSFADKRDAFLDAQSRQQEAVANQVRKETEWLGRKESAQRRKSRSRIEEAADRRAELSELKYRTAAAASAGIDFVGTGRQTKKLLTALGISKQLGDRTLFTNLDLHLAPGMRLGLLGANGSGKSTLLKVLSGVLPPDTGAVTRAEGLRAVVFEQGRTNLDQNMKLRRALSPNGDTVTYRDRPLHVAAWAQRFLFKAEQLDLDLSALSGGEQARVRIAQLMLQPADLLLLDEPTNDLDIPALEVLEESLSEFPGAIILVSHDRDLMDRLCTEVVGLDGEGGSAVFGDVSQWLNAHSKAMNDKNKPVRKAAEPVPAPKVAEVTPSPAAKSKKLSFKEQQELEGMEATVLAAEQKAAKLQEEVNAATTGSHTLLAEACKNLDAAQKTVEKLYARWQELEAKQG